MNRATDTVLKCIEESGINQTILASRMGTDRRNLNQMLHRGKTIKQDKYEEMLECMGYTIELKKTGAIRVNAKMLDEADNTSTLWCDKGDYYAALKNGEREYFTDKDEMLKWLKGGMIND